MPKNKMEMKNIVNINLYSLINKNKYNIGIKKDKKIIS